MSMPVTLEPTKMPSAAPSGSTSKLSVARDDMTPELNIGTEPSMDPLDSPQAILGTV